MPVCGIVRPGGSNAFPKLAKASLQHPVGDFNKKTKETPDICPLPEDLFPGSAAKTESHRKPTKSRTVFRGDEHKTRWGCATPRFGTRPAGIAGASGRERDPIGAEAASRKIWPTAPRPLRTGDPLWPCTSLPPPPSKGSPSLARADWAASPGFSRHRQPQVAVSFPASPCSPSRISAPHRRRTIRPPSPLKVADPGARTCRAHRQHGRAFQGRSDRSYPSPAAPGQAAGPSRSASASRISSDSGVSSRVASLAMVSRLGRCLPASSSET